MKKFFGFLIVAVIFLLVFVLLWKDWILKTAISTGVTTVTGFETQIDNLKFQVPSTIHIQGLKIQNPKGRGFEKEIFVNMPEIFIDLSIQELLKKESIHLREVRLNLSEVNIEKTKDGVSNVSLLTSVANHQGTAPAKPAPQPTSQTAALPFILDKLVLTIRNVSYYDPTTVVPQNLNVDIKVDQQVFENITDPKVLVSLVLMKIVQGTTFGNMLGLGQDFFNSTLKGGIQSGEKLVSQTAGVLKNQASALAEKTKVLADSKVTETLGGAAGATTEKLTGLFGKVGSTLKDAGAKAQDTVTGADSEAPAAAETAAVQ